MKNIPPQCPIIPQKIPTFGKVNSVLNDYELSIKTLDIDIRLRRLLLCRPRADAE